MAITEPADAGSVDVVLHDNGSAEFRVHGTATRLSSNSGRRIYLLVHPDEPPAPGWWIQTPVSIDSEGRWIGVAWFGTRGWEAKRGQRLWLQAVVAARRDPVPAGSDGMPPWVAASEDLQPATASKVVRATVRGVTRR